MAWPVSQDYNESIQDPQSCFSDPELKAGEAVTNALGMPMPRSGNFADVYEFNTPATKNKWAIKCFTRHVPGLRERYTEISAGLAAAKLPFAVDFQYLVQGIRIKGDWFPILKMRWVEGFLLNEFVRDNLDKPALLANLGLIWCRMAKRLREAGIAHADLQHGNVILVPGGKSTLAVKLIDYDGMFVPALAAKKSGEVGHPNYQHPQRLREGTYSIDVDRFPLLVIATALRALSQPKGRELWDRYDNGDNLLFREADLQAPAKSALFKELAEYPDAQTRMLVQTLQQAMEQKQEDVPQIDELLPEAKTTKTASTVTATMPKSRQEPAVPQTDESSPFGGLEPSDAPRRRGKAKAKSSGVPTWALLGGAAFLIVAVATVGGILWAVFGNRNTPVPIAKDTDKPNDEKKEDVVIPKKDKEGKKPDDSKKPPPDDSKIPPKVPPKTEKRNPLPVTPGFTALFNSNDTDGWVKEGEGEWTVDSDGILVGKGPDAGLISDRRDFTNDTLRAELSASADAEIFLGVRLTKNAEGAWRGLSSRVFQDGNDIAAGNAGAIFSTTELGNERLKLAPGETFVLTARAVAGLIVIEINERVTALVKCEAPSQGAVGLFVKSGRVRVKRLEVKPAHKIEGAIEAESMKVSGKSGLLSVQVEGPFLTGRWSGGAQVMFAANKVNEWATFPFLVAAPGKYKVTAYMTKAPDYGIVQFHHDGVPLGEPIDGYAPQAVATGPIELGTLDLQKRYNALRLQTIGANDKSVGARFQAGLDCIVLKPVELAKETPPASDFKPLFNGVDLTGWKKNAAWSVEDGILKGSDAGYLVSTAGPYQDFHLHVKARINDKGKAGVLFRGPEDKGVPFGYEAHINGNRLGGSKLPDPNKTGSLFSHKDGKKTTEVSFQTPLTKPGEWFDMDIIAKKSRIIVRVNGPKGIEVEDTVNPEFSGGPIVLRCYPQSTIEFEKIEIKELPTDPTPPVIADGFKPLFNGTDLTGWKQHEKFQAGKWTVNNGVLKNPTDGFGILTDRGDYKDFHLRMEAKITKGTALLHVRGDYASMPYCMGYRMTLSDDKTFGYVEARRDPKSLAPEDYAHPKNPPAPPGEWFDLEVIARDNLVVFKINGKTIAELLDAKRLHRTSGHIVLWHIGGSSIEFRNIVIKEFSTDATPPVASDFKPIFNGVDLTGWKQHEKYTRGKWEVINGVLTSPSDGLGLLSNRADFKDFHLRMEAKISKGKALLFVRANYDTYPNCLGYRLTISDKKDFGDVEARWDSKKAPAPGEFVRAKNPPAPIGEWFLLEVIARDNLVIFKINGTTIAELLDTKRLQRTAGHIAWTHNANSKIEFRKIEITDLKSESPPVIADGFKPLFNGVDLTGWQPHKKGENTWGVNNGVITAKGPAYLFTTRKDYKDFHLRFEARMTADDGGSGAIWFRSNDSSGKIVGYRALVSTIVAGNLSLNTDKSSSHFGSSTKVAPDEWIPFDVLAVGKKITVKVQGKEMVEFTFDKGEASVGSIGLEHPVKGSTEFRNIDIKELSTDPPPPTNFKPLFDGKNLLGWKQHEKYPAGKWTVKNGVLTIPGEGGFGVLTNRGDFKNFHLRMEAKVTKGKAVLFVRADYDSYPRCLGYGVTLSDGEAFGDVEARRDPKMLFDGDLVRAKNAPAPAGEWFLLEVIARDNLVVFKVNGTTIAELLDEKRLHRTAGHVAFLPFSLCKMEIRKFEIAEFTKSDSPPVATEGFVPLFDGKSLTGWQKHAKEPGNWRVDKGGNLVGSSAGSLGTKRDDYKDFHLRAEARISEKGSANLCFRAVYDPAANRPNKWNGYHALIKGYFHNIGGLSAFADGDTGFMSPANEKLAKAGEWFTLDVIAEGNRITVKVNGVTTQSFVDEKKQYPASGAIVLHMPDAKGTVEFRKIEIKEITVAPVKNESPEAAAAAWAHSIGGTIMIKENGKSRHIKPGDEMPAGDIQLTSIHLSGLRQVDDASLARFKECRNLTTVNLTNTNVGDAGLAHFKDCKKVQTLHLASTKVTDAGLAHFKGCALKTMVLTSTNVTDEGLAQFQDCKDLTTLNLTRTKVTGPGLAQFKDCGKLASLQLADTKVDDEALIHFRGCRLIQFLNVSNTNVTDAGLAHFKDCKKLGVLDLSNTKVSDASIAQLKNYQGLRLLILTGAEVTAAGAAELQRALPDCKITR